MNFKANTTKEDAMNTKNRLSSKYDESTMVAVIEDANGDDSNHDDKADDNPCNMGNNSYADLFNDGKKDATTEQEVDKPNTYDLKSFSSILNHNSAADVGGSDDNDTKLNVSKTNVPKKLNFRSFVKNDKVDNSDIVLPMTAIDKSFPLKKDVVTKVPIWVKLHKVPLVTYSKDGLSLIATQIGIPLMLDAYSSSMCGEAWGHINFARALIEVSSGLDLKKEVTMAVPNEDETDYTWEVISVEYEWQPPRCVDCKIFGHSSDRCPKIIREPLTPVSMDTNSDGLRKFKGRKLMIRRLIYSLEDKSKTSSSRGNQEEEHEERIKELNEFDEDVDEFIFPEGSPRLIVLRYDGLSMMPEDPYAYEQPLHIVVSSTADTHGYITKFDPEEDLEEENDEDLEEDPADYPTDRDAKEEEEESSRDDADDEEEDEGEDEEEEEEH
uniref:Putative ATPase, F1/V1/A1 complex, alpha/beta subunit, zinc knuckle CX2CX4HX4C n=1 Tax=Tanacetum cinerariifolium TaxID=118510 RepID=A0A699GGL1_TANCI|nr:putative ATPase, F1/V1/A1 complex, alpha/beta subunit, zinc knuckle CX2CX4HX4C [Tanacetum cinerariifolium]